VIAAGTRPAAGAAGEGEETERRLVNGFNLTDFYNRFLGEPDHNGGMKDVIPIAAILIMFLGPILTLWLVGEPLVDRLGRERR
jgi:hypothetical protein